MDTAHAPPEAPGNRPACDPAAGPPPLPDRPYTETADVIPPRPPVPASPPRETDARRVVGLARRLARSGSGRGFDLLDRLADVLKATDGLVAAAIRLIQRAQRTEATEVCEQLGLERWLRLVGARTYGDARTLVAMAEVLDHMPETQRFLEEGVLSADVVRRLVGLVKDRRVADHRRLDTAIAANLDRLASMSSQAAWGAIQRLVEREREDLTEARQDRAYQARFVALQPALDGSGALYGQLPAAQFTTVAAGLDAAARRHHRSDDTQPSWKTMGRARADGLEELCKLELGGTTGGTTTDTDGDGGGGSRRRARPSMQVIVDIHDVAQLEDHQLWGQLLSPSGPVQLTPRTIRRMLAEDDPTLRTVFTDGHEILGVAKPTEHVPEALKTALAVRDGHARSPGSTLPAGKAHRNHVTKRTEGGTTTFNNTVTEDPEFHVRLDGQDTAWSMMVDPDGICTYTNPATGRTFTTLPRSMRDIFPVDHPAHDGDPPEPGRDPP